MQLNLPPHRGLTQCLIPKHPKQANKHRFSFFIQNFPSLTLYPFLQIFPSSTFHSVCFGPLFLFPPSFFISFSQRPCCPPRILFCHRVCWNRTNLGIKHEQTQIFSQSLNWIYLLKTLKPELLRLLANRWLKPEGSVFSEGESFIERETSVNLPSSSCRAAKIWRNSRKRFVSGWARTFVRFSCCFVFNHFKYVECFRPR